MGLKVSKTQPLPSKNSVVICEGEQKRSTLTHASRCGVGEGCSRPPRAQDREVNKRDGGTAKGEMQTDQTDAEDLFAGRRF